jgi:hypothetical protein
MPSLETDPASGDAAEQVAQRAAGIRPTSSPAAHAFCLQECHRRIVATNVVFGTSRRNDGTHYDPVDRPHELATLHGDRHRPPFGAAAWACAQASALSHAADHQPYRPRRLDLMAQGVEPAAPSSASPPTRAGTCARSTPSTPGRTAA